ncbi:Holliday junction branch migration protein RuvA [candidate division WWE3 bacterium]|uniref:Holliday junction branch migration complex subunit RuvA n=1 Tax=candidate division WWE3 bacterium TaxID=2053526 RepID=A0A955RR50_UNCKA|nr:Holliday junction branch migration protein RuvA [candidate division WWE3 bacterium]
MIAYLSGKVIAVEDETLVVSVNDIGYEVYVPNRVLSGVKIDDALELWTIMVVNEKEIRLFGFTQKDERRMFETLNAVSGIGPKSALGILNQASVADVVGAIRNDNVDIFTAVSGIGRKNASRIIIELKNKFSKNDKVDVKSIMQTHDDAADIFEALAKFGYKKSEVNKALKDVDPSLSTEKKIKDLLKLM